jgi:hypothetical protein
MDLEGEPKTQLTRSIPTGFRVTQQFITHVSQAHAIASAEGAVRPGPATSFQFKFEPAGSQVAPPPVAVPQLVDLLILAIRSSHRDDVINDLLDWYTIDLGVSPRLPPLANRPPTGKVLMGFSGQSDRAPHVQQGPGPDNCRNRPLGLPAQAVVA